MQWVTFCYYFTPCNWFHFKQDTGMAVTSSSDEKMLSYGWLKFRPRWLQFLNSPKWFLFFLSQYYFTQSLAISGLYPGVASTIEKRFAFSR